MLDDISLGSAHPDLWVTLSGPSSATPGQQAIFDLAFAKRGGVDASDAILTLTLPDGLTYA